MGISDLLRHYCPHGVKMVSLGEVCSFKRGNTITAKEAVTGDVPVIAGGQTPSYYHNMSNREGETISVAGSGAYAGFVNYWTIPVFLSDAFSVHPSDCLITRYVYHFLKFNQQRIYEFQKGAGVPHVHGKDLAKLEIPLPPLPVQQEIVRILDTFTDLQDNLQQELEARKKQYETYREKLLSFNDIGGGIEWKMISEIGTLTRGSGLQKKDFSEDGVGCIHYGQIYTRLGSYTYSTISFVPTELAEKLTPVKSGDLVIACTSENVEDVCKSVVWLGEEDIVTGGHAAVLHHNENPKYIGYCFQTNDFSNQKRMYAYGAKVIDIKTDKLAQIKLPIPSRERQDEIVEVLDSFECTIDNIKKEVSARQKQYEYYREQLLSF